MAEIKMFTADWCGWCHRAKRLLSGHGYPTITEVNIEEWDPDRKKLKALTGQETIPQIFIGDHHVGGYPELVELIKQGRLHPLARS